jgi:RTX calcium-binding nonapeptide repeat (4 copies)
MTQIQLAGNLISATGPLSYGHLQIVNSSTDAEIEVQSYINMEPSDPNEAPYFLYRPSTQDHSDTTAYAPGSASADPNNYAIVNIDIGERNGDEVWELLAKISEQFRIDSPNFFYNRGQNSNSYAATLLWMIGIDVADYIAAAMPLSVSSFPGASRNLLTNGSSDGGILPFIYSLSLTATSDHDFLRTGRGDDMLIGAEGNDTLITGKGDDTVIGDRGDDVMQGGDGVDILDYSGSREGSDNAFSHGVRADLRYDTADEHFTGNVQDNWQGIDAVTGFERYRLTQFDDRVDLRGSVEGLLHDGAVLEIRAGANATFGDTIDFSGMTASGQEGLWFTLDNEGNLNVGPGTGGYVSPDLSLHGFENVIGTKGNDRIYGADGDDKISGDAGTDRLFGGDGDDILIFDADDTDVQGGDGRDVAIAVTDQAISFDLSAYGVEAVVGGAGDDSFVFGNGSDSLSAAGGAGNDTFNLTFGPTDGPRIIWGGDGADVVNVSRDTTTDAWQVGILAVTVVGLTAANFGDFTLDMLNLGPLFDWTKIDVVMINPDAGDSVNWLVGSDAHTLTTAEYTTEAFLDLIGYVFEVRSNTFLGETNAIQSVYYEDLNFMTHLEIEYDEFERVLSITTIDEKYFNENPDDDTVDEYDISKASQEAARSFLRAFHPTAFVVEASTDDPVGFWYAAGGSFAGSSLYANGSVGATMPDGSVLADWLLAA